MPRLANQQHELYARHRARGMIASKAALAAGFAAGSSTTHLENDADIVARIAEVMEEQKAQRDAQRAAAVEAAKVVGSMTGMGRSWVVQQLAEVAAFAKEDRDYGQANRALELIGKEFGMFSGGSGEDPAENVPHTLDLDALANVLDKAHDALPPPTADPLRAFDDKMALSLIEGQTPSNRVAPADRELTTGSETDVALMLAEGDEPAEAVVAPSETEADEFASLRAELEADED